MHSWLFLRQKPFTLSLVSTGPSGIHRLFWSGHPQARLQCDGRQQQRKQIHQPDGYGNGRRTNFRAHGRHGNAPHEFRQRRQRHEQHGNAAGNACPVPDGWPGNESHGWPRRHGHGNGSPAWERCPSPAARPRRSQLRPIQQYWWAERDAESRCGCRYGHEQWTAVSGRRFIVLCALVAIACGTQSHKR